MNKEAKEKLDKYYGTSVPLSTTVKRGMQEFKFDSTSTNDEPCPERPLDTTTLEINKKILRFVTDNRKLKVREISKMLKLSTERVHNILHILAYSFEHAKAMCPMGAARAPCSDPRTWELAAPTIDASSSLRLLTQRELLGALIRAL